MYSNNYRVSAIVAGPALKRLHPSTIVKLVLMHYTIHTTLTPRTQGIIKNYKLYEQLTRF